MARTQLRKLKIEHFRALQNVEIELGHHITVVCGKNGTSKSSILGIAAQIFSFEKDYVKDGELSFRQIAGGSFKSQYSEHFRISDKFDVPGSMTVNIELFDGYTGTEATAKLELMKRGKGPRPVVRNNSTAGGSSNSSRNFTHPVIFLSLKRLYPIADRDYKIRNIDYLTNHTQEFIGLTNELLNRQSSLATSTSGTISSAVAHGENYDQDSVSAGEDNAGQIIMALMSFRKLKEEYSDYKGGLLLIDEADAGLFPTAQVNLLRILDRECKELNLQVVMTSHSPVLIQQAYEQSERAGGRYRTVYLSNTFGDVQVMQDWSWTKINADLNTQTVPADNNTALPKVNVFFEDNEAADFFAALMSRQPIKKFTNPMRDLSIGCSNYLQLISKGVPDFSERGVVCLDADAAKLIKKGRPRTVVLLPGALPPDQLIFEMLYNLPAGHEFWRNELGFTRDVFTNSAADLIRELGVSGGRVDVHERVAAYPAEKKPRPRELFKRFYKGETFNPLVRNVSKPYNPWRLWIKDNPGASDQFLSEFRKAAHAVMKSGFAVDPAKLDLIRVKLKTA